MPTPNEGSYAASLPRVARALPLSRITLPAMVAWPWGESSSASKLFGTMPLRLCDQSEFTRNRSPDEFEPE